MQTNTSKLSRLFSNFKPITAVHQADPISLSHALRCIRSYDSVIETKSRPLNIYAKFTVNNMDGKRRNAIKIRGFTAFQHPFSFTQRILSLTEELAYKEICKNAGAEMVGGKTLIADIMEQRIDLSNYDFVICDKDMFSAVKPAARYLQTLFPSEKKGTLVPASKLAETISIFRGSLPWDLPEDGMQTLCIGQIAASDQDLFDNIVSHIEAIKSNTPSHADSTEPRIKGISLFTSKDCSFPLSIDAFASADLEGQEQSAA